MKGNELILETSHFATSMILGRKGYPFPVPGCRSCCQAEADKKRRKEEEHRLQLQREVWVGMAWLGNEKNTGCLGYSVGDYITHIYIYIFDVA